jgi:hypothetical protein
MAWIMPRMIELPSKEPSAPTWPIIDAEYRAGIKSVRQIAAERPKNGGDTSRRHGAKSSLTRLRLVTPSAPRMSSTRLAQPS